MADIDFNALGQSIDTSWGRSSTPRSASHSVKFRLLGTDKIEASYATIVKFITEKEMIEMKRSYVQESGRVVDAVLAHVKTNYKDLSGLTLRTKELTSVENLEIINLNVHNPLRTAYYRRKVVFEIS